MKQHLTQFLFATLLLAFHAVCTNAQIRKNTDENLYSTTKDDTQMNAAMATAKRRFGQFDSAFKWGHYDQGKFSLKVQFANSKGHEYIWVTDIALEKGQYWGLLSDTPATDINVRYGERLKVGRQDVVDWLYGKDSILHGGYTIRVLELRMTKKERVQHDLVFPYKLED
jgi:uncharacterized protein YegJ (DUF2314 family)